jgi:hypothetical protein
MTADPYQTCSNCTHDKTDHEYLPGALGFEICRCNILGCTCRNFQTIRREFVDVWDPIKGKMVRKVKD